MYQKLLLKNDGGIIDIAQQSEQDNCAVVCIGLGGTGVDCLKTLKAKIYNRVRPDDPNAAVPKYSHIKFLAVDTDKTGLEKSNAKGSDITKINMDNEFFDLSYPGDISNFFKANEGVLENRPHNKEWLRHQDINVLSAKAGAGGVRQLGRYLLMEKATDFVSKVSNLVNQAKSGLTNPKTYIHVFSGISGGTGAGTFLDVCYLIRQALTNDDTDSFILGYFFLPDVNIANNLDKQTEAYVKVNGYASLQDLDYCMNFERNGDKWSQVYNGIGLVESQMPPVDICHLISARDTAGNVIPGAYKYSMNVVTDYFMDFVVRVSNNFTMESHIANYTNKKAMINKEFGATYEYCVLGASAATLPFKEVLTYLASEMFGKFSGVQDIVPGNAGTDAFIAANGLKYDTLFAQLVQRADMSFPLPDVKWGDAKNNDNLTVTYFTDLKAKAEGVIESNYSAMIKDMEGYEPTEGNVDASKSVITKIYSALRLVAADPQKGPFYAAHLLRSTSTKDLIAIVDGYIEEVQKKYSQENIQEDRLRPEWEASQTDFFNNASWLNGGGKYDRYRNATRNLILHYTKLTAFQKMKDFLERLRKQLVDLADNFMDVFRNVMKSLIETFDANKHFLEELPETTNGYEFPLATISQLKDTLDLTIKEMDISSKATDFLKMMLSKEGVKAWINSNENEIYRVVNKYFTTLFAEYSNKTMTSYLQDKYHTTNMDQLVMEIRNDIMNKLDQNANPMFWTSTGYSISTASHIGYVTFPNVSTEVDLAAQQLAASKQTGELTVRNSTIQDRISIMRCLVGVPLFGYQGLLQYEDSSIGSPIIGKHLYEGKLYTNDEGKSATGRDWRFLPSPVPLSKMNASNNKVLRDKAEAAKEIYELAEKKNIIAQTAPDNYGIFVISADFMKKIYDARDAANGKTKVEQLEAIAAIKELMESIEYEPKKVAIPNDGATSLPEMNKRIIRIDHFASSIKLQEMVKAEVAKFEEIDKIIAELEPKEDKDLVSYQNGIFTGVIKITGPVVKVENEFGEETELSAPAHKPCGAIPLYQAFLNFKKLDADTRAYVAEEAQKILDVYPLSDDAVKACKVVWAQLKNIKLFVQTATKICPHEVADLKKFLPELKDALQVFGMTYFIDLE